MLSEYLNHINPVILAKIEKSIIKAKLSVEDFSSGVKHSKMKGSSVDFSEHRQYTAGDEIKHLDWKIYGKTDRFYIKEYQQETNLKVYILLDTSKSMEYGSGKTKKSIYSFYLTLAIAHIALKQMNSVGLITFSESINEYIPQNSSFEHIKLIMNTLNRTNPSGKTNITNTINELGNIIKKRSLIILISDLFDEEKQIIKALKLLKSKRHNIITLHLLDSVEIDMSIDGNCDFICNETMKNVVVDTKIIREEYKKTMARFIEGLKLNCNQNNIEYSLINTCSNKLII